MGSISGVSEIEEVSKEPRCLQVSKECDLHYTSGGTGIKKLPLPIRVQDSAMESHIDQLFEAIDIRAIARDHGQHHHSGAGSSWKKASKKPMRVGPAQTSGIGISESVTLKQALRGLCISHAAELASMKRHSKHVTFSTSSTSGIVEVLAANDGAGVKVGESVQSVKGSPDIVRVCSTVKVTSIEDPDDVSGAIDDNASNLSRKKSAPLPEALTQLRFILSDEPEAPYSKPGDTNPTLSCDSKSTTSLPQRLLNGKLNPSTSTSGSSTVDSFSCESSNSEMSPSLKRIILRTKKHIEKKRNREKKSTLESPVACGNDRGDNSCGNIDPCTSETGQLPHSAAKKTAELSPSSCAPHGSSELAHPCAIMKTADSRQMPTSTSHQQSASNATRKTFFTKSASPASHSPNNSSGVSVSSTPFKAVESSTTPSTPSKLQATGSTKENPKSTEKGDCSQSSLSSIGDYSSSSGISDESVVSVSSSHGYKPHTSKDPRWSAIHQVELHNGTLGLKHFKLLKKLGCGDIGTVYLAELTSTDCVFALKVMELEFLISRKKMLRAQTEKEILQMLDHPFLPTLYSHFTTDKLLCLVMEYCPGGDLHVLRQRQPGRFFSEQAARFYAAEVLLALEYLHMMGVVYRDLKPENILVREDGHIMLSDFDLSLRCAVNPTLIKTSSRNFDENVSEPCLGGLRCANSPMCLEPAWVQTSCFTPKLISIAPKSWKPKVHVSEIHDPLPQLVVEPTDARSNSFVGTHEYLAPEIIRGDGHGSAVDWWTFGIFLYELLYGKTPFKGPGNPETLANAVAQSLKFPEMPSVSSQAKDLIRQLLAKDPESRLGSVRGAAEIKCHSFFEGLNWALIRSIPPPDTLKVAEAAVKAALLKKEAKKPLKNAGEQAEFEHF